MTIDDIIIKLKKAGVTESEIVVGCTDEEVQFVEHSLGHSLPEVYKEFLRKLGHKAGSFCDQLDIFYDRIPEYILKNQARFRDSINNSLAAAEGNPTRVPENTFLFAVANGEFYCFFDLEDPREDPPVYGAGMDSTEIHLLSWSFTASLELNLAYM